MEVEPAALRGPRVLLRLRAAAPLFGGVAAAHPRGRAAASALPDRLALTPVPAPGLFKVGLEADVTTSGSNQLGTL